jgi:diguanylate cyclase (GGDEF)-like protein
VSSWNRRVAAAARVRESIDPGLQASRLAELGLPAGLHPDDATTVTAILRLAEGREGGFETTIMGRVFAHRGDDESRLVKIVVVGNGRNATVLVGSVDDDHEFDSLTGLPSRDYMLDQIDRALQGVLNSDHRVGVFAIDIDRFKRVNDTHGYAIGDETLRALAAELISVLGPDDVVGRYVGNEFIVVCPQMLGVAEAAASAERFRSVCAASPVDSLLAELTLSVGIAIGGPDRVAEDLLKEAETALNQAKVLGRDRSEIFDDQLRSQSERRVTIDQRLRTALDHDAVRVHLQPIVELATGRIVGAEALLRLADSEGIDLSPHELVTAAESSGLIRQIEERVLERAAHSMIALNDIRDEPIHLSVNVSDQRLNDSRFPLALARALHSVDLPAELLHLEVSTNVLDKDSIGARLVSQLRALGVRITVDRLDAPSDSDLIAADGVDMIKLSRDLTQSVHSETGRARARLIIGDLNARGVAVCAVGVETPDDLAAVEELGCRFAQGFYFARPMEPEVFAELLVGQGDA